MTSDTQYPEPIPDIFITEHPPEPGEYFLTFEFIPTQQTSLFSREAVDLPGDRYDPKDGRIVFYERTHFDCFSVTPYGYRYTTSVPSLPVPLPEDYLDTALETLTSALPDYNHTYNLRLYLSGDNATNSIEASGLLEFLNKTYNPDRINIEPLKPDSTGFAFLEPHEITITV